MKIEKVVMKEFSVWSWLREERKLFSSRFLEKASPFHLLGKIKLHFRIKGVGISKKRRYLFGMKLP